MRQSRLRRIEGAVLFVRTYDTNKKHRKRGDECKSIVFHGEGQRLSLFTESEFRFLLSYRKSRERPYSFRGHTVAVGRPTGRREQMTERVAH
jgi:hypothetical protein